MNKKKLGMVAGIGIVAVVAIATAVSYTSIKISKDIISDPDDWSSLEI